ncbi:MAG: hypothetical protein C5B54_09160 [Acidobacteria bacterium]|nr:MAG: hypothetical protein C5B54_09160 [Acidobacteriota bacterium]
MAGSVMQRAACVLKFNPYHGEGGLFSSADRARAGQARTPAEHTTAAVQHHAEADRQLMAYYRASIRSQDAAARHHQDVATAHRTAARTHEEAARSRTAAQSGAARRQSQAAFALEHEAVHA